MTAKSFANRRFFIFSFVVFAIASVAVAKFGFTSQAETPQAALLVPTIAATNVDAITTDLDGDGRADPGDTIQYTVTITNAGTDATGVQFSETLDANTTIVGGTVNTSPIAADDSFSVLGNVSISVPDGASDLLGNDIDPDTLNNTGLTASGGATSAQGGNVVINSNGSFTYNPPPGFEGSDSFTYTVTDASGATGTATVTLSVSGMVWFINNNAAACTTLAGGCGRLSNPFSTLAAFQALNNGTGNNPAATDNSFLFESGTAYTGGVTLLSGQKLIGQDATATLQSITGVTVPTFGSPALPAMNSANGTFTTLSGTTTLNTNTVVRGLRVSSTTATGINDPAGAITGVNISEIAAVSTTTGTAVSLSDTSGTISLAQVSSNGAASGISLTNTTGSFTVSGTGGSCTAATPTCSGGTISNVTDTGIKLTNASNVTLTRMRIQNSPNFGLNGATVNVMNIDTCVFDGTHGNAIDEGALFVTNWLGSGTISNSHITGGGNDNIRVRNTTGVLNRLTITSSTITNPIATSNHGLRFATDVPSGTGSGVAMNLTVTGSTFLNNRSNHFDSGVTGLSAMDIVLNGNTFVTNGGFSTLAGAVNITSDHQSALTFDVNGNTMNVAQLSAVNFFMSNQTSAAASMVGKFRNNNIGTTGVANSGSAQGNGVGFSATGLGTVTVNITGNQIRQFQSVGIQRGYKSGRQRHHYRKHG